MQYTSIPGIGLEVSRICLGTWAIGGWLWGGTDEAESKQTIRIALDKGINIIDTAPVYGFGLSEEIVGRAVKESGLRQSIILATKGGLEWDDKQRVRRNSTPQRLRQEVDDSLRRLQTDYIDVYQIHWPDPLVPFEETGAELNRLKEKGKIVAAGVSNYTPEQMDALRSNVPLSTCQPPYNLFERDIEKDVQPYCRQNGITLLTYGAICRGLLSGRMDADTVFPQDDLRSFDPKFQPPSFELYLETVRQLDDLAQERFGKRVIHLAVRWVLDQGVEIAIWGARRPEQLDPLGEITNWSLENKDLYAISAIVEQNINEPLGPEFMSPPQRR